MELNDLKVFLAHKLERIERRLEIIDKTAIKHDENLKEHMRRTELLEREVHPIKVHVYQITGIFKFIGYISAISALYFLYKELMYG